MKAKGPGQGNRPALPDGVLTVSQTAIRLKTSEQMVRKFLKEGWLRPWYRWSGSKNMAGIIESSVQLLEVCDHERVSQHM